VIGSILDSLRYSKHRNTGRRGEDLAHRFLKKRGYTVVARNFRLSSGDAEADIIAWDGETLAIVEVKSRETANYGPPERAIGDEKRRHMLRVARAYARKINLDWSRVRFDVVTVIFHPQSIELHRDAIPK